GNSAGINQAHAVFDARTAIRNLGEVVSSQFFLVLETKWTVVGGDDLEMIAFETVPELFLMPLFTQGWSKNIFRTFEIGNIEVLNWEIQILRAGFCIDGKTSIAGLTNFLESLMAAQMNNVDRSSRHFRKSNRAR